MCQSDWRFGRFIRSVTTNQTLAAAGTMAIAANNQRVGLTISTGSVLASTAQAAIINIGGANVAAFITGTYRHDFSLKEHGDLVNKAIIITNGSIANVPIWVTEYIADERMLTADIKEFQRN